MAQKNSKKSKQLSKSLTSLQLPSETKRAIIAVILIIAGIFLSLAAFGIAGIAGSDTYRLFAYLLGVGYFLLPVLFFILAGTALREASTGFTPIKLISSAFFVITGLGFIAVVSTGRGGVVGQVIANPAVNYLDVYAALIVLGGVSLISLLVLLEGRISLEPFNALGRALRSLWSKEKPTNEEALLNSLPDEPVEDGEQGYESPEEDPAPRIAAAAATRQVKESENKQKRAADTLKALLGQYTPPPLSLLERDKGRPGVGDIKANANIIKRTLQNFGISVELDEISIGPSVTRYAIKPAEGVRLQKIVALQQNLALALAAKGGIRIEAPIPGKSLVGIEVPNSAKVTVGLGTLLESPEFVESAKPLLVALGRDIGGASTFGNIAKMPHVLIAGATGSGKSVTIHAVINSLLYRAGPQQLRFIMIDPKRVELTMYNQIPHLLTPVITDSKKAIMALRWAVKEMERRYGVLEQERVRDIESYHQNILTPALEKLRERGGKLEEGETPPEAMPYIMIIIDELADIMSTFPRELEASVVRLAQMSRAIGIHLVLSTQRPSVNVITGLIKANVPSRIALQVASQIDSRTILDQGGAETLLGAGDMLYLSADMNKPVRLQSAFISENEVKKVTAFIAENNEAEVPVDIVPVQGNGISGGSSSGSSSGGGFGDEDNEIDDDMYENARQTVIETGKASTSYLQRKLGVGYSRAARLIDILEERGVIGPSNGSKPRDVLEKGSSSTMGTGSADAPEEV
jgi:S-DNA-T family DNA segregation ATPase FtsK/SpoIIIE